MHDVKAVDWLPLEDAVDYRVYELPSDGDVSVHADVNSTDAPILLRRRWPRPRGAPKQSSLRSTSAGGLLRPQYLQRPCRNPIRCPCPRNRRSARSLPMTLSWLGRRSMQQSPGPRRHLRRRSRLRRAA